MVIRSKTINTLHVIQTNIYHLFSPFENKFLFKSYLGMKKKYMYWLKFCNDSVFPKAFLTVKGEDTF